MNKEERKEYYQKNKKKILAQQKIYHKQWVKKNPNYMKEYGRIRNNSNRVNCSKKDIEELREFIKENDIKLLELLRYMRRRNDKKIQKGDK